MRWASNAPTARWKSISQNLRDGMTKNGIPHDVQEQIVNYTKAFANYGFPESHAFSFALLAYASAYFMVHYRACFMTAMFNNYPLGFYSAATLVKDAQRHGLHFLRARYKQVGVCIYGRRTARSASG